MIPRLPIAAVAMLTAGALPPPRREPELGEDPKPYDGDTSDAPNPPVLTPDDLLNNGQNVRKAQETAGKIETLKAKYTQEQIRAEIRRRGVNPDTGGKISKKPHKATKSQAVSAQKTKKARAERTRQRKHRQRNNRRG